jgi:ribosomal protein S13
MTNTMEGFIKFHIRPSCIATFDTIYGIGRIKASRLNAFLFNHPNQTMFHKDFVSLMQEPKGRNIMNKLFLETKIRLNVSHHLRDKIFVFCYQAYRMFQNLPTKGQRTHGNAGTPSRLNPYLSLNVNQSLYPVMQIAYKRRELMTNGRYEELKAFNDALVEKDKMKKIDEKQKSKLSKQAFYKNSKNK